MGGTLGGLYCRRNLSIRGRKKPHDLLGERRIGGKAGKLALPQIEIAPGQAIEFGFGVVVFGGHGRTIAHHGYKAPFAPAHRALSHCGIGAKVTSTG